MSNKLMQEQDVVVFHKDKQLLDDIKKPISLEEMV